MSGPGTQGQSPLHRKFNNKNSHDLGQTNKPIAGIGPTTVEQATQWCVIGLEPLCSDLVASMPCLTQGLLVSSFPAPFGYSWLLPDPMSFQRSLSHSVQILLVPT